MPITSLTRRTRTMVSRGDEHVLVLGSGPLGRELASTLSADVTVTLVDDDEGVVQRVRENGISAHCAKPTDVNALQELEAAKADLAVVATASDRQSVLATQLLRSRFGIDDVVVLVNDPDVGEAVEPLDVETVCVPELLVPDLAAAVDRRIRRRG